MNFPSILLGACALLLAFSGPGTAADEQGQVSVQFVRVPSTADHRTAMLQLPDKSMLEVELPSTALSEPYLIPRSEAWVLGKSVRDDEGNKSFIEMGRAAATKGERQVVVVIDKGEMNDGKLELIAMDLTAEPDAFQFINASNYKISGELGIERFGIAPMEHALLKAEAGHTDEHNRRFCDVAFSFLKDKDYVKFIDASWRLEKHAFALVIFHQEAMADKLKMTVIRDFAE